MLKPIAKLLKALSSNTDPGAIASAFAMGAILGVMPKDNLLWYLIFIFFMFMRIQRGSYVLSIFLFSAITPFLDPYFDKVGYYILTLDSMRDTYIRLLDIPFVAFTKFNNTIVMGSFACGIVMYIPIYIIVRIFIFIWRRKLGNFMRKLSFIQFIKRIPLIEKIVDFVEEA